jgi:hypothetical protein
VCVGTLAVGALPQIHRHAIAPGHGDRPTSNEVAQSDHTHGLLNLLFGHRHPVPGAQAAGGPVRDAPSSDDPEADDTAHAHFTAFVADAGSIAPAPTVLALHPTATRFLQAAEDGFASSEASPHPARAPPQA